MDSTVDSTGTRLGLDWDSTGTRVCQCTTGSAASTGAGHVAMHHRACHRVCVAIQSLPLVLCFVCSPRETALWQHVSFFETPDHWEADSSAGCGISTAAAEEASHRDQIARFADTPP